MKNFKLLMALVLTTVTLAPTAQAEVAANVALTTDYVWRGVSQNNEDPALQGGFDANLGSGFYVGIWGSNVDFGGPESTELDLYGGWTTDLGSGFGFDIGYLAYTYHGGDGADASDFDEVYVGLTYSGFGVTYYSAVDDTDDNIEISYGYDFEGFSVGATYGDYDSYAYYTVGVSTEVIGIGVDLSFWDTDSDGEDLNGEFAEERVVLSISKAF